MKQLTLLVMSLAFVGACSKKDGDGASSSKAAEAKPAAVKLDKLGVQLDISGDSSVSDGLGANAQMITGEAIGAMQVEATDKPQTIDEAKSDAAMYSPKNLKADALADGWAVTYDNKGSMGANYFVTVRRDIGGKTYNCTTTGSKPEQATAVLAACKSLRK